MNKTYFKVCGAQTLYISKFRWCCTAAAAENVMVAMRKMAKYADLPASYTLQPVALEVL